MKTLNAQARLACAQAAIAVLHALKISDSRMYYEDFAKAIGIMSEDEKWHISYRQPITHTLNLVAATARQAGSGEVESLQFERLVRKTDDEPGPGYFKECRIVCTQTNKLPGTASV